MSKDPATSRIARLDGISRIPTPGSFGWTGGGATTTTTAATSSSSTSHIRPPVATKSSTQIFRKPALPTNSNNNNNKSTRPISSYHPTAMPLHDLGTSSSSIKKSSSGEPLNNAGNTKTKWTSNVFKKYFGQSKLSAAAETVGAAASKLMTSSLPLTPLPAASKQLTSSTPMALMRSETFVCDEEEHKEKTKQGEEEEGTPHRRDQLESTRISGIGFRRTMDMDTTSAGGSPGDATQILSDLSGIRKDRTHLVISTSCKATEQMDTTQILSNRTPSGCDGTQILGNSRADRTRPVIPSSSNCEEMDATYISSKDKTLVNLNETITSSSSLECQKPMNLQQTLDLTKSMDQLPLLEHMSMPSGVEEELDVTLTALAPDKSHMKLPLNSTLNTERLLDLSGLQSPAQHIQLLNLTRELLEQTPERRLPGRRSMAAQQHSLLNLTPQSATTTPHGARFQQTPVPVHLLSPLMKSARSDLVLPTRTPEGEQLSLQKQRYSFGLELPETSLDFSIELVNNSCSNSQQQLLQQSQQQLLKKQHSFDLDESLGILTPDQMKEFLDSSSQQQQQHQLELLVAHHKQQQQQQQQQQQHLQQQQQQHLQLQQQLRLEQTPSPEELPLDPIEPQLLPAPISAAVAPLAATVAAVATTTSCSQSKLSNSFITSVTSVTSLDTGYQGDGEMSRPASRGAACDHSPSNGPHLGRVSRQPSFPPLPAAAAAVAAPMRRQDPMTDSDFFTESDADDVLQRGDRRAQVIDGHLYGPTMQPSASVPQLEDSCMESSGIFTDVENRCDEELRLPELELDVEMDLSPDDSTQTMRKQQGQAQREQQQQSSHSSLSHSHSQQQQQARPLSSSSAATTLSNRTSYCSVDGGSAKSFCDEAFNETTSSSSGSQQQQQQRSSTLSVQRAVSPRPHASASLTSFGTVENLHTLSSNSSSLSLPKTPKSTKTTTTTSVKQQSKTKQKASPIARKAHTPNKWDAVMHKIASNKSTIKTNYNDVKSKVSTTRSMAGSAGVSPPPPTGSVSSNGGSPRISPTVRRSPAAAAALTSTVTKRSSSSSVRPKSASASSSTSTSTRQPQDKGSVGAGVGVFARLSKSPTSPTAAAAAAAAKRLQPVLIKRGRSYSKDSQKSSHSDLSSLCNSNGNGGGSPKLQLAKTPLRAAKKRDVRNLSISPTDLGPPPKTQQTTKGQSTRNKSTTPTPIAIQKRSVINGSAGKGSILPAKATPQKPIKNNNNATTNGTATTTIINNKNGTKILATGISEESLRSGVDQTELQELSLGLILSSVPSATQTTPRDSKRSSLGNNELPCICGADNNSCNCAAEKAPKVQRCGSHTPEQSPIEPNSQNTISSTNEDQNGTQHTTSTTTTTTSVEDIVAHNPALKCYMDNNGYLNHERLAKCLEANSQWLEQGQRQTTGLAIVVQFMCKQMDMLSCEESKARTTLEETIALLQQTQKSCEELQQQLHKKDVEWTQRQQEREHQQHSELQQAQDKVQEMQMIAKERFRDFESQLLAKDEEKKQALQSYHQEVAHQLRHKQQQLNIAEQQVLQLQTRLQDQEAQEAQLHEKLTQSENTHATRLKAATQREDVLQDQIKALTKELQTLRASNEHNERDLRDRLALSQDEISVLRSSSQRRSGNSNSNSSNCSQADTNAELSRLTSEADSLRCVLELKQAEISTLSKQNAELQRENDEQRGLSNRVTLLVAQNEMLRTELEAKTEKEKDTQRQMEEMQKAFNHENIKRKRLTCDKEELQYHLKQRSEQLQLVQAQLHDLSQNYSSYSRSNSTSLNNTSPPTSPVIKGVIERNDSVSWVLEMDDETPQVAASKLVRRAGSLRSNSERSPTQRRQHHSLSLSANAGSNGSGSNGVAHGPNPLSQSMSATALMRSNNHPEPESPRPLCRARSQSVCMKDANPPPAKQRQNSELTLPDWHANELTSSSPQHASHAPPAIAEMRARSSTMKLMSCVDAYPKALKKFQEIQESAGEAMVSGANSEDESCSASSEDMRSSSASSTASAAGCTLSKRQKQPSRMSIEEALMLEQVNGVGGSNSLNGTPMEVSWSEDAADADVA